MLWTFLKQITIVNCSPYPDTNLVRPLSCRVVLVLASVFRGREVVGSPSLLCKCKATFFNKSNT